MTNRYLKPTLAAVALSVVLAACGGTTPTPASSPPPKTQSDMVMPGTMTGEGVTAPTVTQALICGEEIRTQVRQILALPSMPQLRSGFAKGRYTCTYTLPQGPMRLAVQHLADAGAARAYLTAQSGSLGARKALPGLGDGAYGTGTGIVLVLKDNEVLEVDTTSLPKVFGSEQQKRSDLAFEMASVVLGCWTGDDS